MHLADETASMSRPTTQVVSARLWERPSASPTSRVYRQPGSLV
jgi:hypothetical protein